MNKNQQETDIKIIVHCKAETREEAEKKAKEAIDSLCSHSAIANYEHGDSYYEINL